MLKTDEKHTLTELTRNEMVQSMDTHALLPSLLGGLLGLLLFPTSAFYFHSSNKPFYLKHSLHLKVFYLQHRCCCCDRVFVAAVVVVAAATVVVN